VDETENLTHLNHGLLTNQAHRRAEIARRKHTDSMAKKDIKKRQEAHGYSPGVEINESYAALHPHNCAVRERTADGVPVGVCTFYLKNGTDCPRHGRVKAHNVEVSDAAPSGGTPEAKL